MLLLLARLSFVRPSRVADPRRHAVPEVADRDRSAGPLRRVVARRHGDRPTGQRSRRHRSHRGRSSVRGRRLPVRTVRSQGQQRDGRRPRLDPEGDGRGRTATRLAHQPSDLQR